MQRISGFCEEGNVTVSIAGTGYLSSNKVQGSFPGCLITVYNTGTLNLSTIWADNAVSPTGKANPFTSATDGTWFFYAEAGVYDVKFSGAGIPTPFTLTVSTGLVDSGVPSYPYSSLPTSTAIRAGSLARVTDGSGGLFMDSGVSWVKQNNIINARESPFYLTGQAGDDATTGLNLLIDALNSNPSLVGYLPEGTYSISASLHDISVSGVRLIGSGLPSLQNNLPVGGTLIKAIAGCTGTMLTVAPTDNSSNFVLYGNEVNGIGFHGNAIADKGLVVKSVRNGFFRTLGYGTFGTRCWEWGVRASITGTKDSQLNYIEMVGFFTGATEGYLLDGIESVANTSINRIVADIYSTDGQCGRTGTSDTNTYLFERYFVAGTATYSVSWGAGSVPFEGTRNDQHMMFIANKAAHADTGTSPAYNIRIWTLDRLDATPFPVIGAGASVYWMNESTPIYDGTVTTNTSIVPTSGSGTFTSVSSSLKYWKTLNYLNFELAVTITTNGSAAGSIVVAMPVACLTGAQGSGAGLDTATSIGCIWSIQGASSNLIITKYDGTYPGGTGKVIQVNGSYRTAP